MKAKAHLSVLWSDEHMLVVDKPAGLPTLPDGYDAQAPHLLQAVEMAVGQPVWVVHRLDRDTSGVVVFARTAKAHRALNAQFEGRRVAKVYHALVAGHPAWNERRVTVRLQPDGDRRHRTIVSPRQGKPAVTGLLVLERWARYALVEARPETGRTHQVRVHLAAQGTPIVADELYGDGQAIFLSALKADYRAGEKPERPLLGRLGLHAWALTLEHPLGGERLRFEAPYPKDFAAALRQLRKYG
jgi:RluA family pseudouridine synthase